LFDEILERQLRLKGILSKEDWEEIKPYVRYTWQQDSHFAEMKHAEVLRDRVEIAQTMDEYIGRFYSTEWVRKNVLMQTEEDIDRIDKEIQQESDEGVEHGEGEEDDNSFEGGEAQPAPPPTTEEKKIKVIKKLSLLENKKDDLCSDENL
jgi:hypothetical protein